MIVFHVAITAAEDYLTRREGYRRGHIERLQGLRAASILVGGGPAPDGKNLSAKSNQAIREVGEVQWLHSYVTGD